MASLGAMGHSHLLPPPPRVATSAHSRALSGGRPPVDPTDLSKLSEFTQRKQGRPGRIPAFHICNLCRRSLKFERSPAQPVVHSPLLENTFLSGCFHHPSDRPVGSSPLSRCSNLSTGKSSANSPNSRLFQTIYLDPARFVHHRGS